MVNKSLLRIIKQMRLTSKHALIYEILNKKPATTPLQLSRETKLNRSSLYRYLEELRVCGLVELILGDKTSKYRTNPDGFDRYLASEELRVTSLKSEIPALLRALPKTEDGERSEIKYFQGIDGLKQMLWNVVASGHDFVGLGYEDWNTSVGKSFAERLRAKNVETGARSREITNDKDDDYEYTALGQKYYKVYEHRGIDKNTIEINQDTYIYGDVFAYYYHYKGEHFGVEIHNKEIAKTERQMFEILWKMAK